MKIVCLESFLAETVDYICGPDQIVGVLDDPALPEQFKSIPRIAKRNGKTSLSWMLDLTFFAIDVDAFRLSQPDVIFTSLPDPDKLAAVKESLHSYFGKEVAVYHHAPIRLDEVFEMFDKVGKQLKDHEKGKALSQRLKAQMMDWSSNFYDRLKNKRVTFISSVEPLQLGGRWIPDMVRLASGSSQGLLAQEVDQPVRWEEIVSYNPDVIVVAPRNLSFEDTLKSFKIFEKFPHWEDIYAVKRGDVYFTDGVKFFNKATPALLDAMGILVSAMAGLESGYITPRDVMFKLRWLELQRHRF